MKCKTLENWRTVFAVFIVYVSANDLRTHICKTPFLSGFTVVSIKWFYSGSSFEAVTLLTTQVVKVLKL